MFPLFSLSARFSVEKIKGISPSNAGKYRRAISLRKNTFTCFDKSKIISLDRINDGYCDCPDGSDEPGTNACGKGEFYCRNEGSVPKSIPLWLVNDGVCDCCDGSDEAGNPYAHCEDVCGLIRKRSIQFRTNMTNISIEGNRLRTKYSERGRLELNIRRKQLQLVDSQKNKLMKSSLLAEKFYWSLSPKIDFNNNMEAKQILQQFKLSLQDAQIDFDKLDETIKNLRKGTRKVRENVPHYGRFNPKHRAELYYNVETAIVWLPDFQSTFSRLNTIYEICQSFLPEYEKGKRPKKATSLFNKISALISKVDNSTEKIKNIMLQNFGPDKEFVPLYKNWYYFSKDDYYIEFYPYFNISKIHGHSQPIILGIYNQSQSTLNHIYNSGNRCNIRNLNYETEVHMHCNLKDKILNIHEEDFCHWVLDFGTPAACTPEYKRIVDSMDDITLDDWAKYAGLFSN